MGEWVAVRVALTFDAEHPDRPTADAVGNAVQILEVLAEHGVLATFFVQSGWASAYPEVVRGIAAAGHLVGSHSHRHCPYTSTHRQGIFHDLQTSRRTFAELGIDVAGWFRLPGGRGSADPSVLDAVRACSFSHVGWTASCGDWRPGRSVASVVGTIVRDVDRLRPNGVSVPVLHSWPDPTPAALRQLFEVLGDSVQYVRLDQLDPGDVPRN